MNKIRIISCLIIACTLSFPIKTGNCDRKILDVENEKVITNTINTKPIETLTNYEIGLISKVVMAEAEGEPFEGKRYVVDTILNRVDSNHFPDTVHDVIYQKNQFTSIWNGRFDRCEKNEDLYELISKEYNDRENSEIMFFTAGRYSIYGKPAFKLKNHYFSTYN